MKHKSSIILLVILTALFVVFGTIACGPSPAEETTKDEKITEASEGNSSANVAEESATSTAPVKAQTLANLNLRQGPGTNYTIVGNVPANTDLTVVGRNADSSWLLVENGSGTAWMSGQSDLVSIDSTVVAGLPVVDAPPPAYDASNPNVARVLNEIPLVVHHDGSNTCASHGGLNNLFDVANGNVIGPHSGDFVYGADNVLFEYSNGSLQLIRENPVARFENGEKYLSFDRAMQLFASGEIVWTGTLGDWPARGVTGCDPAASQ